MKARVLALYLPQYHPVPENDMWWGKGFTEWSNVTKAKPLFRGHYQPKLPTDLGFYDLRLPEVREEQAKLAKEAGIEGFIYWHYWFGNGKRLLERPFNEVLESGKPDFPFALAWANHTWSTKTWKSAIGETAKKGVIMEQTYPGVEDYTEHFYYALKAFKDPRYITVDGKPVFFIYDPSQPAIPEFISTWRNLAPKEGLKGIHFVSMIYIGSLRSAITPKEQIEQELKKGFDAVTTTGMIQAELKCGRLNKFIRAFVSKYLGIRLLQKYKQEDINRNLLSEVDKQENVYPTIIPNWDRSPRGMKDATIYTDSTPEVFKVLILKALNFVKQKNNDHKIIVLKSWNEWGEGNYVEPDVKYGRGYIDALKSSLE